MLIALCPKCNFPIWFGTTEDPQGDADCQLCGLQSNIPEANKVDEQQWRDSILGDEDEFNIARNTFYMNFYHVADKMDLPQFLAEWRLLTQSDLDRYEGNDLGELFREEFKCLIQRLLKRLNEKSSS